MKKLILSHNCPNWYLPQDIPWQQLTQCERMWLLDNQSLTTKLRGLKSQIKHILCAQGWDNCYPDEQKILPECERVWCREIVWQHIDQLWVVARVAIPSQTFAVNQQALQNLGSRSLGEVLFATDQVERQTLWIAKLAQTHYLFDLARLYAQDCVSVKWARRSLFYYFQLPLLVTEIFLPPIFSALADESNHAGPQT